MSVHYGIYADKIRTFCYTALACGGVYILAAKIKNRMQKLILLCFINLFINTVFMAAPYRISGQDMWQSFCSVEDAESIARTMEEAENQTTDWYRIDRNGKTRGESLIQGYRGCTAYYSIMNGNIWKFYDTMMISSGICGGVHCLIGLDDRMGLESLLSIKYTDKNDKTEANEYVLPLGVEYMEAIPENAFLKMTPMEKQDAVISGIVLENIPESWESTFQPTAVELPFTMEYRNIEEQGNTIIPREDAKIFIHIEEELPSVEEGEVYLYFKGFQSHKNGGNQSIEIAGKEVYIDNPESVYSTGQRDYLVKVDTIGQDIAIKLPEDNFFTLEEIQVYLYPLDGVKESILALKEHSLKNLRHGNDMIEGDISAAGGYLFLSIPYDKSWKVYVDDVQTPTCKANIGFTAVKLNKGEHHVRIVYDPILEKAGFVVTFGGIIILCSLLLWDRRQRRTA